MQEKINQILKELNQKKSYNEKAIGQIKKIVFKLQTIMGINKDDNSIKIISERQKKMFKLLKILENEFKKLKK
jgi:hypothetical protein